MMKIKEPFAAVIFLFLPVSCVLGDITYTLHLDGVNPAFRTQIETSIAEAVMHYNKRGSFNKLLNIYYDSTVPTANANYLGTIRFGGQRSTRVALHEIAHTLGVGTITAWRNNVSEGIWTGSYATGRIQEWNGLNSVIHGDKWHFWPYGLNYDNEDSAINRIRHIQMVAAFRTDMGLLSFVQEPESLTVALAGTAVFNVVAPNAAGFAWYKQPGDVLLTDGGDIAGAATDTLTISNAAPEDEGYYYCVASGSLSSRPARLFVEHWELYKRGDYIKNNARGSDSLEVGNKFITGSTPPTITALGFIDLSNTYPAFGDDGDGLLQSHRVTLWLDSNGSKVTEVIVPAGSAGYLIDSFRYAEIPQGSLTLLPNTAYVISTDITGTQDKWLDEEILTPNGYYIDQNMDDSATWQGRWGTPGQRPVLKWHTGTFYGLINISSKIILKSDFNGDGVIDLDDLNVLSQYWLGDAPLYDIAPGDGDGIVDLLDFQVFAEEWAS